MADNTGLIIIVVVVIICSCCVSSSIVGGMGYTQMNKKDETEAEEESAPTTKAAAAATKAVTTPVSTPAAVPVSKFNFAPKINTTGWNEIGYGPIYLDRHNVDCKKDAINNFKLDTLGGRMQYVYNCTSNSNLGDEYAKVNEPTEANAYFYLDKQNIVGCGENEVMSQFNLHNAQDKGWQYMFKCLKSKTPLACRDVEGPVTDIGKDHTILKSHPVKCEKDEALNSFRLNSWKDGQAKTYYSYKCCK